MEDKGPDQTFGKICSRCGKRIAGSRRLGSLTSYLFGAADCSCARGGDQTKTAQPASSSMVPDDSEFCPKCGLKIAGTFKDGSLTGFLFQSTRCKCPPDQEFAQGKMSARFWKLKQTGSATMFASTAGATSRASAAAIDLAPGAIIGGVYNVIQLIGRGGMGEVYLARHETLGKKCALKVIPPEQVTEIGWLRFQMEARAVAKLDHINLVRVTDLGIHEGCLPFYAMEYVEGHNLAELLAEQGAIPLKTVLEIFVQVCDGVECAHKSGILHRDLKPANIMVATTKSGMQQAKILDFGLAKLTRHDRSKQSLTSVGDIFGSPFYMSPEQCDGDKLDMRSDIYSLGCTMFECLTGQPPFTGHLAAAIIFSHLNGEPPSLESVAGSGKIPASMEVVLAKLLRKNPVDRYQTLSQLKSDLQLVMQGKDVQPVYVSRDKKSVSPEAFDSTPEAPPIKRSNFSLLAPSALVLLLLAGSLIYFSTKSNKIDQTAITAKPRHDDADDSFTKELVRESGKLRIAKEGSSQTAIPVCKTEKGADGKSYLVFKFRHDLELGTFNDPQFPGGHITGSGEVRWPVGSLPMFQPSAAFLQEPANFDVFQPNLIGGLDLRSGQFDQKDAKLMHHIGLLTGLRLLILDDSDISDADLEEVKKIRLLESLSLNRTGIDGAALARLPQLRNLRWLSFQSGQGASALLAALKGSDKLYQLYVDDDRLTPADFRAIASLSGLTGLHADNCGMTTADLDTLASMPRLQGLCAADYKLSAQSFKSLKIMCKKGLEHLSVSGLGLSKLDRYRIHTLIPRTEFREDDELNPDGVLRKSTVVPLSQK